VVGQLLKKWNRINQIPYCSMIRW